MNSYFYNLEACPFTILEVLGGIHLPQYYILIDLLQENGEDPDQYSVHRIMRCLIWVCTVCQCPIKRTLG